MKYKTYRQLTPEQKEEWQFRFKDKVNITPSIQISSFIFLVLLFLTIVSIFLFVISVMEYYQYNESYYVPSSFLNFWDNLNRINGVILIILSVELIIDLSKLIYYNYQEAKWLKETKIVIKKLQKEADVK